MEPSYTLTKLVIHYYFEGDRESEWERHAHQG